MQVDVLRQRLKWLTNITNIQGKSPRLPRNRPLNG
jgi:hypothetical protein